ncbi:pentatricopeptide repeat-containing protein At1g56690, mitochondrial-like [Zingiber officinale]|uniref:pentatricopeptide repeat-containing protein At1g56690, mitochondrial-like n=1 Tax=Zingiber officinale TaxID=94328 RepID=UPI001C4BEB6F|nr:pentatricopeptide repeat-containing protein At1g56690, mitochondrial-like [Zingiber officinale]
MEAGYAPDVVQATTVAEGEVGALRLHSERLAFALGLLEAKAGEPIRVMKNLRVCGDYHAMIKLVSKVYDVVIMNIEVC